MCNLLAALLVACVPMAGAAGAFGSLWMLDLRRVLEPMWPGYELFTAQDADYGQNKFALLVSHPTQYWFEVYALWTEWLSMLKIGYFCPPQGEGL